MFVPGAKRASAAGLMSDGAARPGVGEAEGVGDGGGVGEAVPAVTVRLADVVVSKNAVMVTNVRPNGIAAASPGRCRAKA